jgi:hypothetical protein
MLFSLRSIVLFSALMAASLPFAVVGAVTVPSDPDDPVVTPGAMFAPDDCAVPVLLVPGEVAAPDDVAEPLPPVLCARDMAGETKSAPTAIAIIADVRINGKSPLSLNRAAPGLFRELSAARLIEFACEPGGERMTGAQIELRLTKTHSSS